MGGDSRGQTDSHHESRVVAGLVLSQLGRGIIQEYRGHILFVFIVLVVLIYCIYFFDLPLVILFSFMGNEKLVLMRRGWRCRRLRKERCGQANVERYVDNDSKSRV